MMMIGVITATLSLSQLAALYTVFLVLISTLAAFVSILATATTTAMSSSAVTIIEARTFQLSTIFMLLLLSTRAARTRQWAKNGLV